MDTSVNNKSEKKDFLDILFSGRNKTYGAYFLRKTYPKRLRNSILWMLLLILFGFSLPQILKTIAGRIEASRPKMTKVTELGPPPSIDPNTPPPPPPPKIETPPPPPRPTVKFVPPIVKKDEEVVEEEEIATQDDLKDADPDTQTQEGDPNSNVITEVEEDLGSGPAVVEEAKAPPKEEVFTIVEQMPSFPGGDKELLNFIYSNIKYPALARENGVEGTAVISFVVDESGNISKLDIVRDIGAGCGQEALRVAKLMPPWNPGRQNGRPVKVLFKLPVRFKLQ